MLTFDGGTENSAAAKHQANAAQQPHGSSFRSETWRVHLANLQQSFSGFPNQSTSLMDIEAGSARARSSSEKQQKVRKKQPQRRFVTTGVFSQTMSSFHVTPERLQRVQLGKLAAPEEGRLERRDGPNGPELLHRCRAEAV